MASAEHWSANGCDFNFGFCRNADFWYHLVVAQKTKVPPNNASGFAGKIPQNGNVKNYDLHNVLGFYSAWVVLIIALTGLVWGFQWFANSVYWRLGGEKSTVFTEAYSDIKQKTTVTAQSPAIDRVWQKMLVETPRCYNYRSTHSRV